MINWICENYQFIVLCCSTVIAIVTLVIGCIRRRININMVDSALSAVLQRLPGYIKDAENNIKDGKTKFAYVLAKAVNDISLKTDIKTDDVLSKYGALLTENIENILTTPQKKEVVIDEKKDIKEEK